MERTGAFGKLVGVPAVGLEDWSHCLKSKDSAISSRVSLKMSSRGCRKWGKEVQMVTVLLMLAWVP